MPPASWKPQSHPPQSSPSRQRHTVVPVLCVRSVMRPSETLPQSCTLYPRTIHARNLVLLPDATWVRFTPCPHIHRSSHEVTIHYQNVGGMNTSINHFRVAISENCFGILVFIETWLNGRTLSSQIFDNSDWWRRTDSYKLKV